MRIQATIDALPPITRTQPLSRYTARPGPIPEPETPAPSTIPSEKALMAAVEAANRSMAKANAQVQFAVDEDSGRTLIRVVDTESRQVIRQIPSEEMLAIARNIEKLQGLIVRGIA